MKNRWSKLVYVFVLLSIGSLALAQSPAPDPTSRPKGNSPPMHAAGTFDVKLAPQGSDAQDPDLGRMTIDKQFHGGLDGTSKGQMLTAGTTTKGSAGYVAIEKFTGTLNGRTGSFVLQHNATMNRGVPQLNIIVVPDSGTGQLAGLTGKLNIIIADGSHSYEFEYTIPDSQ